jgi:hypothetical protein
MTQRRWPAVLYDEDWTLTTAQSPEEFDRLQFGAEPL